MAVCKESFNTNSQIQPNFTKEDALIFFRVILQFTFEILGPPRMGKSAFPSSDVVKEFGLSPITPGNIRRILKRYNKLSAPDMDGITYAHLKNLLMCHYFLVTLYTEIFLETMEASCNWDKSKVILLDKRGDPLIPSNYRPIVLLITVGKLFHKFLAWWLEKLPSKWSH